MLESNIGAVVHAYMHIMIHTTGTDNLILSLFLRRPSSTRGSEAASVLTARALIDTGKKSKPASSIRTASLSSELWTVPVDSRTEILIILSFRP